MDIGRETLLAASEGGIFQEINKIYKASYFVILVSYNAFWLLKSVCLPIYTLI